MELETYSAEALTEFDKNQLMNRIASLEASLQQSRPDMDVLEEYKSKLEIYLARAKDLKDVTDQRDESKMKVDQLMKQRLTEFMSGFSAISLKLKEMYQVRLL